MRKFIIIALAMLGALTARSEDVDPQSTPLVALLSSPRDWNGKLIITSGFFVKGSRSNFLFQSSNDAKFNFIENAIVLDPADSFQDGFCKKAQQLDGQYVRVFGNFFPYNESSPTRGMVRVRDIVPGLGAFDASIFRGTQREIESALQAGEEK